MNKHDTPSAEALGYYRKQAAKTRKLAQEATFTAGHVEYLVTRVEALSAEVTRLEAEAIRYGIPNLLDKMIRLDAENARLREGIETVARRLTNGQQMFSASTHDPAERYMGEMQRALTALLAGTD